MIISVNWLKKFVDIDMPIPELVERIGSRLVEIEEVIELGAKYKDVLIVKVVESAPLEGTDHLSVTKIDDGGIAKNVERDDKGLVIVVCGAPNVKADMYTVWVPPGVIVPSTFSDDTPLILGAKPLRGVVSNGMLVSAKELALFDDHDGIIEINQEVAPGTLFASTFELDDYLLDIENKSLTHRPDAFGIVGFAREVAAITAKPFVTPDWLADVTPEYSEKKIKLSAPIVAIDNNELAERYQAVVLADSDAARKSPLMIQTYLARAGVRPINAVVDVTNYLMLLSGQPLHVFDYDKLLAVSGDVAEIHVRGAKLHEELVLLDGRVLKLSEEDIVIAAGDTAVSLAGAMGGASTMIDENTKRIIIESATFNLYRLRATQMRHGIFTEGMTRFTKGQPQELTAPVLHQAVELLESWAGSVRVSDVADSAQEQQKAPTINLVVSNVNSILGTLLSAKDIEETLRLAEFAASEKHTNELVVDTPYWRKDIHIPEDLIEEIGRLRGFDTISPRLPIRDFTAISPDTFDVFRQKIRNTLARAGANEVLTYSFVHGDSIKKANQQPDNSYAIVNSISPELEYYRQSLTPSLLGLVHPNSKQGYDSFAVFELNKVHSQSAGLTDEHVPEEADMLGYVVSSKKPRSKSAPFYDAKQTLEYLAHQLGITFNYVPVVTLDSAYSRPYEVKRSAWLCIAGSDTPIGIIGEYTRAVKRSFKLEDYTAGFELDCRALFAFYQPVIAYQPLSRYPSIERDVCYRIARTVTYADITNTAKNALATIDIVSQLTPLDIYQPESGDTKNITIRLKFTSHVKTLSSEEANEYVNVVSQAVTQATGATVI